ncbi:6-pyruvoyl trahydropterin synthase family protein [Pseudobacteriovorax antillogorgiicola]|uniref:6-carboxy-5,6,7,8-tetrahydropterin synthase n=1 Tax=Pseudobacteriovorax antillogorgiicola TaxID=1513793 RepID=A0A1Y6C5K7_9BACT|nr:6-carboxytetrahydropterin synthase [Pseudobacteriovorax antillogorgiicola]TCS49817.1 6-pyruvoyltetrahydropterin/6-carboxytetrahydropterin synthase [Pseudobacteriovorax antillogorgiicola]SMF43223.1 6-pyruvoyltetrahydropterin/6-carboxytetrahydropterin synthase [Pseudobacteriovorax antillogorgiicola]
MYEVGIKREVICQHYLIGGDWGHENCPHSHHFVIEMILSSPNLDDHGYVADISKLNVALERLVDKYRDRLLNDLPEFDGLNPSIENFSRIIASELFEDLDRRRFSQGMIKVWEDGQSWASYRETFI